MTQQSIEPLVQINLILCQEEDHQNSHFQEEGFQQDHQEEVQDFQEVEVCLEEDPHVGPGGGGNNGQGLDKLVGNPPEVFAGI